MSKQNFKKEKQAFAENLLNLREQKGLSQKELGAIIGVNRSVIASYEDPFNDTLPRSKNLLEISEVFGVSLDYLFGKSEYPTNDYMTRILCEFSGLTIEAISSLKEIKADALQLEVLIQLLTNRDLLRYITGYFLFDFEENRFFNSGMGISFNFFPHKPSSWYLMRIFETLPSIKETTIKNLVCNTKKLRNLDFFCAEQSLYANMRIMTHPSSEIFPGHLNDEEFTYLSIMDEVYESYHQEKPSNDIDDENFIYLSIMNEAMDSHNEEYYDETNDDTDYLCAYEDDELQELQDYLIKKHGKIPDKLKAFFE